MKPKTVVRAAVEEALIEWKKANLTARWPNCKEVQELTKCKLRRLKIHRKPVSLKYLKKIHYDLRRDNREYGSYFQSPVPVSNGHARLSPMPLADLPREHEPPTVSLDQLKATIEYLSQLSWDSNMAVTLVNTIMSIKNQTNGR